MNFYDSYLDISRLASKSLDDSDFECGYDLPKLPYSFEALEPVIDATTMRVHHGKHHKKYVEKNFDKISNYKKEYDNRNKDKLNKNRIIRKKNKYLTDINYRIKVKIRNIIFKSFKRFGYSKVSKTNEILGCSFEEFKLHLESNFEDWMTWENKGLYNGEPNYGWDIDYIIPISSAETEDDIIRLNHYTNLQPLCSRINRNIKKDQINYEMD